MPKEPISKLDKLLAKKIKKLREENDLALSHVAIKLDISWPMYKKYEELVNKIPISRAKDIADIYDEKLWEIIKEIEEKLDKKK